MKTNLLKLLALLSMIVPFAANAAPITYEVNRMIGAGTVTGMITTDGTIGAVGAAQITGFALTVTDATDSFGLVSLLGAAVLDGGGAFLATATQLTFDFGGVGPVGLDFRDVVGGLFGATLGWGFANGGPGIEAIVHVGSPGTFNHSLSVTGRGAVEVIGTVASLPEPGTLGMALLGLAGLVLGRKRKLRQAAAV